MFPESLVGTSIPLCPVCGSRGFYHVDGSSCPTEGSISYPRPRYRLMMTGRTFSTTFPCKVAASALVDRAWPTVVTRALRVLSPRERLGLPTSRLAVNHENRSYLLDRGVGAVVGHRGQPEQRRVAGTERDDGRGGRAVVHVVAVFHRGVGGSTTAAVLAGRSTMPVGTGPGAVRRADHVSPAAAVTFTSRPSRDVPSAAVMPLHTRRVVVFVAARSLSAARVRRATRRTTIVF